MFAGLFGRKRVTNKFDVFIGVVGALYAVWKAQETYREFKQDQEEKEINQ